MFGLVLAHDATAMDHSKHESKSGTTPAGPATLAQQAYPAQQVADTAASFMVVDKDCSGGHCPDCFVMNEMALCSVCIEHDGDQKEKAIVPVRLKQELATGSPISDRLFTSPPRSRMCTCPPSPLPISGSQSTILRL